jgi:hypothetical protein
MKRRFRIPALLILEPAIGSASAMADAAPARLAYEKRRYARIPTSDANGWTALASLGLALR